MKDALLGLIREKGKGAMITREEIVERLGSTTGYIGLLIKDLCDRGYLEIVEAGKYRVL